MQKLASEDISQAVLNAISTKDIVIVGEGGGINSVKDVIVNAGIRIVDFFFGLFNPNPFATIKAGEEKAVTFNGESATLKAVEVVDPDTNETILVRYVLSNNKAIVVTSTGTETGSCITDWDNFPSGPLSGIIDCSSIVNPDVIVVQQDDTFDLGSDSGSSVISNREEKSHTFYFESSDNQAFEQDKIVNITRIVVGCIDSGNVGSKLKYKLLVAGVKIKENSVELKDCNQIVEDIGKASKRVEIEVSGAGRFTIFYKDLESANIDIPIVIPPEEPITEPPSVNITDKKPRKRVIPGIPEHFDIQKTNIPIERISVSVKKEVLSPVFDVSKSGLPQGINPPAISGRLVKVKEYLDISKENITNTDIETASIKFNVDKEWLNTNNISEDQVVVFRLYDGEWQTFETTKLEDAGTQIVYEVVVPGFSVFAIGGKATTAFTESKIVSSVSPENPVTITFSTPELLVLNIELTTVVNKSGVNLTLKEATLPTNISGPTINDLSSKSSDKKVLVYKYLDITTDLAASDIQEAKINITVEKSWLSSNNITHDKVSILRFSNGWQELNSTKVAEDGERVLYLATTPGFSIFSVVGQQPISTPLPSPTPPSTTSPTATPNATASPTQSPTPTPIETTTPILPADTPPITTIVPSQDYPIHVPVIVPSNLTYRYETSGQTQQRGLGGGDIWLYIAIIIIAVIVVVVVVKVRFMK